MGPTMPSTSSTRPPPTGKWLSPAVEPARDADEASPVADHKREGSVASATPLPPPPPAAAHDAASQGHPPPPRLPGRPDHAPHQHAHHHLHHHHQAQPREPQRQPVDPELAQQQQPGLRSNPGYVSALRAWSRFRFVRAGWFTAQEAIEYID